MLKTLKRGALLFVTLIFVLNLMPRVEAADPTRVLDLIVAYDEEWEQTALSWFGYGYTAEKLAKIIIADVFIYYFYPKFKITARYDAFMQWNSDNSVTDAQLMLNEAIAETGFTPSTPYVIIAFIDQHPAGGVVGYTNSSYGAVLVTEYWKDGIGQYTDNILQHELSHLYGAEDHYVQGLACVMNYYPYWVDFPWYYWTRICFVENEWCSSCVSIINENRASRGRVSSGGGSGDAQFDFSW